MATSEITCSLLDYVVNQQLHAKGLNFSTPNQARLSADTDKITRAMVKLCQDTRQKHSVVFDKLLERFPIAPDTIRTDLEGVMTEMFSDQVNWGRIITLYSFCATLAEQCIMKEMPNLVPRIVDWTAAYINATRIRCWIDEQGGWRKPVILKSLDIGSCVNKWSWDYLRRTCGDRKVKIHVSPLPQMDFIKKNFIYRSLTFDELINRIQHNEQTSYFLSNNEKYYLRSLGDDPRSHVADIKKDFPLLADDICFPHFFDDDQYFSSVFRISSCDVQLWTHYDVMDNILMVVSGKKRVVMYEPQDALYLYLQDDKSKVLDIDNPNPVLYPEFHRAIPHECVLHPGDVLFIPALWFHNVINVQAGVAVNVFWRHLPREQYDKNDVYGNKDLDAAARAGQIVDRALKLLDTLPDEYRDFYARKLIARIQSRTFNKS